MVAILSQPQRVEYIAICKGYAILGMLHGSQIVHDGSQSSLFEILIMKNFVLLNLLAVIKATKQIILWQAVAPVIFMCFVAL